MAGTKRVLIIAYAFPPNSAVGSMRPLRFCRYLTRETAWQPLVLTTDRQPRRQDPALLASLPEQVEVVRTPSPEPYYRLHPIPAPRPTGSPAVPPPPRAASTRPSRRDPVWRRFLREARFWLEEPIQTPDPQVFWNISMARRGIELVREHDIDVVLATAPPWSCLLGAGRIAAATGRPLVIDFRDPWTDIVRGPMSPWRRALERHWEGRLCGQAARVLSTSETYSQDYRDKYPRLPADRFATLHNGFDEEAFAAPAPPPPAGAGLTVVHMGSLYAGREPTAFFAGAARWLEENPERRDAFKLVFVGAIGPDIRGMLDENGLLDRVEVTGFLEHREAIARCRAADLLLLAMGSGPRTPRGWLPSKLFEYLACDRPILAHTVDGEAAALIRDAGAGEPVTTDDPVAFARQLAVHDRRKREAGGVLRHANDPAAVARLTQGHLVRRLAAELDAAAAPGGPA